MDTFEKEDTITRGRPIGTKSPTTKREFVEVDIEDEEGTDAPISEAQTNTAKKVMSEIFICYGLNCGKSATHLTTVKIGELDLLVFLCENCLAKMGDYKRPKLERSERSDKGIVRGPNSKFDSRCYGDEDITKFDLYERLTER